MRTPLACRERGIDQQAVIPACWLAVIPGWGDIPSFEAYLGTTPAIIISPMTILISVEAYSRSPLSDSEAESGVSIVVLLARNFLRLDWWIFERFGPFCLMVRGVPASLQKSQKKSRSALRYV
jgi:hypothetical protein